jgi:hypothetical protein
MEQLPRLVVADLLQHFHSTQQTQSFRAGDNQLLQQPIDAAMQFEGRFALLHPAQSGFRRLTQLFQLLRGTLPRGELCRIQITDQLRQTLLFDRRSRPEVLAEKRQRRGGVGAKRVHRAIRHGGIAGQIVPGSRSRASNGRQDAFQDPRHVGDEDRCVVAAGVKPLAVGRKEQRVDLAAMT